MFSLETDILNSSFLYKRMQSNIKKDVMHMQSHIIKCDASEYV